MHSMQASKFFFNHVQDWILNITMRWCWIGCNALASDITYFHILSQLTNPFAKQPRSTTEVRMFAEGIFWKYSFFIQLHSTRTHDAVSSNEVSVQQYLHWCLDAIWNRKVIGGKMWQSRELREQQQHRQRDKHYRRYTTTTANIKVWKVNYDGLIAC